MAQRGTASSKKAEAALPAFASVTAADIIRAPVTQKSIPLDLASLIVPFKKQGRLTLRVERMPQRAKLSAGRNNGDGTWSLASDELEDLTYLVPSNLSGGHELSIRIMSVGSGDAQTLKVIPLAIAAWDNEVEVAPDENIVRSSAETHDPILHNELSKMQSMFAVRDSDLAELRAALKQANDQKESDLAAARASWEAELNLRLAEVAAQARTEAEKRQQGQTVQAAALEKIAQELSRSRTQADERLEAERKAWQVQADQRIAEESNRLKAASDQRLEAERKHWHAEAQQRIAEAFGRSKAETDQQFEAERKRLQEQAEQRIAEESSRCKAQADQQVEAERTHWQAQMEQRVADERGRLQAETEQKITEERARAKMEADQRVEAERQLWQAQTSNSGEVERHRLLAEAGERLVAEQKRWQDQTEERLAAERQRWQSESEQRLEAERQSWANSSQAAALEAEARWKSEEAVRASAALAQWQQQSAQALAAESDKSRKLEAALAAALAQPASAPIADGGNAEAERLRQELSVLQGALPERDREIAQLREDLNRQRQGNEAALAAAVQAWKAEQDARTQALVADARAQAQDTIAAAIARAENAERALEQAQSQPGADTPRYDDAYIDGLRRDISTLRSALAGREVELGHARAALDQARVQQVVPRPGNAPIRRFSGPDEEQEERKRGAKPTFIRDFAIMMGVLVPVILGYPYVAAYLPDGVRSGISTVTGGLLSVEVVPPSAPRPVAAPAPSAPRPTASVTRSANIRSAPATTGAILVTLPRDSAVVVLKTEGSWTQVEIPAKDAAGKPQQGWVFSTYLKSGAVTAPKAASGAASAPTSVAVKPATPAAKPASATVAAKPPATVAEPEKPVVTVQPEPVAAQAEPAGAPAPEPAPAQ